MENNYKYMYQLGLLQNVLHEDTHIILDSQSQTVVFSSSLGKLSLLDLHLLIYVIHTYAVGTIDIDC